MTKKVVSSASTSALHAAARYWLVKAEPDVHLLGGIDVGSFPFSRLVAEKIAPFYGVRGGQAKNYLRDEFKKDDIVLYYHSSCKIPGVYGIARVKREGYGDDDALNPSSPFFDKTGKHTKENPYWFKVDLEAIIEEGGLQRPVTLEEMKAEKDSSLSGMKLFNQPRLSVQPVEKEHFLRILELSQSPPSVPNEKEKKKKATGKRKRDDE
jgi:predicted RNA-binding protein with PUA-like domain